jgi:hypothetical protein
LALLEDRAAAVDGAGAATVVYLRYGVSNQAATRQDARELMDGWGIETAPGARDGLVVFANLQPGSPNHGSLALYCGARHVNDGRLSEQRLQHIYDDEMRPLLMAGDLVGGIARGLDTARLELEEVSPDGAAQRGGRAADLAVPLAGGGLAVGVAVGAFLLVLRNVRRGGGGPGAGSGGLRRNGSPGYVDYSTYAGSDSGGGGSGGSDSPSSGGASGGGDF